MTSNNTPDDYTANLVIHPSTQNSVKLNLLATEKMRQNKSEVKWRENKVKVVDGRQVLSSKAVK